MNRNSFVFYKDWMTAIQDLPDDIRLEIYEAVIEYATTGNLKGLKPMASVAFNFIKTTIDRDTEKYGSIVERNKNNGSKGGRPPKKSNPKNPVGLDKTQKNPKEPKKADNDNDNDSDNDSVNDNEKNTPPYIPPSFEAVKKYFDEKGYSENAARKFYDYYEELKWHDKDGNPVKNWKLKAINVWFRPEHQKAKSNNRFNLSQ